MKHLILIGMMGCGKTTCGTLLSQQLGMPFLDTDQVIEERENDTISALFERFGEEYFRERETELVRELIHLPPHIIATGGGLPLREENAQLLRQGGLVIWLRRDPSETFSEECMNGRPLAQNGQADFIARFHRREPLYRRAAHVTVEDFSSPKATADEVLRHWKEYESL